MNEITSNELKLQVEEQLLSRDIISLDKREAALAFQQRRSDLTSLSANIYISAGLNEMMGLSKIKQDLIKFSSLMIDTMNQRETESCMHIEGMEKCKRKDFFLHRDNG